MGRARRVEPRPRPSTKADGGLWYTEASDAMWHTSSSSSDGSSRSVSSEMSGFSASTTCSRVINRYGVSTLITIEPPS